MAESELLMVPKSELDGRESISSACTELRMDDGRLITSRLWAVEPRPRLIIVQMGLTIRNDCAESLESEVNCQAVCSR